MVRKRCFFGKHYLEGDNSENCLIDKASSIDGKIVSENRSRRIISFLNLKVKKILDIPFMEDIVSGCRKGLDVTKMVELNLVHLVLGKLNFVLRMQKK